MPADQKTSAGAAAKPQPKAKKKGSAPLIALIAIIVVIAVLYYLYSVYGTLPSSLVSAKLSGEQFNASTLKSIMLQKVYSSPMFAVDYSGSITTGLNDPGLTASFLKYYNNTRTTYSFSNMPVIGSAQVVVISLNSGQSGYICANATNSAMVAEIFNNANSTKGYQCISASGSNYQKLSTLLNRMINTSSAGSIQISSYSLSSFNGQPCYVVSGSGSIRVNSTLAGINGAGILAQVPSNFTFNACFSSQYNIPINFSGRFSPAGGLPISITLQETSISTATTQSEVEALPDPIANLT